MEIVGRKREVNLLDKCYYSVKSEFVAVYGRRRVGKTYLIRQKYEQQFAFYITGLANAGMAEQLENFAITLARFSGEQISMPKSWLQAFNLLQQYLNKKRKQKGKLILFFDELPWLDTPRSRFLSAFEHFWNSWASGRNDIMLIACGSATSWIIQKLFKNKGGLHNRVTQRIKVEPFLLPQVAEFAKYKKLNLSNTQLADIYMALGGIPFYLEMLEKGKSAAQNIDAICFGKNAPLADEFENLYASLFKFPENHIGIIKALAKKNIGLTREELIKTAKIPNGGGTTKALQELEESGFIRIYTPLYKKKRNSLYQLVDQFTLFYFNFLDKQGKNSEQWLKLMDSPKHRAWSGYAFEQLCFAHIEHIKKALGISGIIAQVSSWYNEQAQIDMVIDRTDGTITLCEMKYSSTPFVISKKYANDLKKKLGVFKSKTNAKKAVHLAFITSNGLINNEYSAELIQNEIELDAMFHNL
jgi:AAA+ ATPase superfamily predicted ATPase